MQSARNVTTNPLIQAQGRSPKQVCDAASLEPSRSCPAALGRLVDRRQRVTVHPTPRSPKPRERQRLAVEFIALLEAAWRVEALELTVLDHHDSVTDVEC